MSGTYQGRSRKSPKKPNYTGAHKDTTQIFDASRSAQPNKETDAFAELEEKLAKEIAGRKKDRFFLITAGVILFQPHVAQCASKYHVPYWVALAVQVVFGFTVAKCYGITEVVDTIFILYRMILDFIKAWKEK